ncbi:MAG: GNAT family N-acetyltransferase [Chloroflexia bacterium]|nr:GNAT family N-acetyltransferase [Chloroflexia bacterium]
MSESSSAIRIVPITADLFPRCWRLRLRALHDHPEAFGQPYDEASALSEADMHRVFETFWSFDDNAVFGAIMGDGSVVGMTGVARWYRPKMSHRVDIWGFYVAPEYRGQGIANRLLETAIDYARSVDGVLQLHLQVVSTNVAATRSYARAGFERWGRMPRADIIDGQALDNDFMVLMLDATGDGMETKSKGTFS